MAGPWRKARYVEYLLIILAGIVLLSLAVRHVADEGPIWAEVSGIVLGAFLTVSHVFKLSKTLRRDVRRYVVLKSETGSVRVHASAVEEALRHTAKSLPEVHDVHVRMVINKQTSTPEAAEVDARIRDITNIVSVHDALSRVLNERYEQIIPGAPRVEFHLTFRHYTKPKAKPKKAKKRIVPPEEDETKAIRAPQYPVPK